MDPVLNVFLGVLLYILTPTLFLYGFISYKLAHLNPTGQTRLVKNGVKYEIEVECKWFFGLFRSWRMLSRPKSSEDIPPSKLIPKPLSPLPPPPHVPKKSNYYIKTFDTPEEAEDAAIEWRTQNLLKEKKHENDGRKYQLTAPVR